MYKLDEQFLNDLGLEKMPIEQKSAFLQHIYSELELRVGEKLTEGMSPEQLDEFGCFVDRNEARIRAWFATYLPDYATLPDYIALTEKASDTPELVILSEYGATKWLQLNRPDYPQVVGAELEKIKTEISANREAILGDVTNEQTIKQ